MNIFSSTNFKPLFQSHDLIEVYNVGVDISRVYKFIDMF